MGHPAGERPEHGQAAAVVGPEGELSLPCEAEMGTEGQSWLWAQIREGLEAKERLGILRSRDGVQVASKYGFIMQRGLQHPSDNARGSTVGSTGPRCREQGWSPRLGQRRGTRATHSRESCPQVFYQLFPYPSRIESHRRGHLHWPMSRRPETLLRCLTWAWGNTGWKNTVVCSLKMLKVCLL